MAKTRVHELAKEFGVESKFVLEKLKEMGEFVKSPSSTVELPVEMKFKKEYGEKLKAAAVAAPAEPTPAKTPAKKAVPSAPPKAVEVPAEPIAPTPEAEPPRRPRRRAWNPPPTPTPPSRRRARLHPLLARSAGQVLRDPATTPSPRRRGWVADRLPLLRPRPPPRPTRGCPDPRRLAMARQHVPECRAPTRR